MKHIHIVGGGLAGTLLAWELLKLKVDVTIEDIVDNESSSRVAAGMITPITGKRLKPTWRGQELTQIARETYEEIELAFGVKLWKDWTLRRVFREEIMLEWFHERLAHGEYGHVSLKEIAVGTFDGVEFPYGGFEHGDVATVDLPVLTDAIAKHVATIPTLSQTVPDVTVNCTGYQALTNPLWSWLPIEPSKGEILDVEIAGPSLQYILTNGTWILPLGGDRYRVGATHDWDDHTPTPTENGRTKLLAQARELLGEAVIVIGHRAAVRPSTKFKRPLVGLHPVDPFQAVFNGLGTKGALQGPWAAKQLAQHLVHGEPLDPEIDIKRWWGKDV